MKKSLTCALSGIACAVRKGRNLRIMFACAALVILVSLLLRLSGTEWAIVLLCCGGVIALEMVNTALEYIVDLASPAYHELAKRAKDVAAGAVLIGCLFAAAVGLVVFVPHIAALF
jgi:diacylglycerol kinase